MNLNNAYAILQDKAFTVQVRFYGSAGAANGKVYTYLCDIEDLQVGDNAVVITQYDNCSIPKVVYVVSIDQGIEVDLMGDINYSWIVQRVDYTSYDRKMQEAADMEAKINKLKRDSARAQLKAALVSALGLENEEALNSIKKD